MVIDPEVPVSAIRAPAGAVESAVQRRQVTERGGRVQVRLARVNSDVEVTVSDTGIGIAPEFCPTSERFRQADAGITRERGDLPRCRSRAAH
jgi:hypothetical protein